MFGRKRRKRRDGVDVGDAAVVEGGCCLFEVFGGLSCLALIGLIPLLMR